MIKAAKKVFEHTNANEGRLQMYQAQNELISTTASGKSGERVR